jgi:hypothetical protein
MGDRVRFHMAVPDKLKEMAIIITARNWAAQFEWLAHRPAAVQAGLSEDKVTAIAEGRRPVGMSAEEEALYNFMTELFKTKQASDSTLAAVENSIGERGLLADRFHVHERAPTDGKCQPETRAEIPGQDASVFSGPPRASVPRSICSLTRTRETVKCTMTQYRQAKTEIPAFTFRSPR